MTHDPFCTRSEVPYDPWRPCYCDVIAKVRADERNEVFTSLDKLANVGHTDDCRDLACGGCSRLGDDE